MFINNKHFNKINILIILIILINILIILIPFLILDDLSERSSLLSALILIRINSQWKLSH